MVVVYVFGKHRQSLEGTVILAAAQQLASQRTAAPTPANKPNQAASPAAGDTFAKSEEKIPAWAPFANAAIAAAVVGAPAAIGAGGAALIGPAANSEAAGLVISAVGGIGAGTYAFKSSMKEFRGHPVLVGATTLGAGFGTAIALPLLMAPGVSYGWQGAAIAAGAVGAVAGLGTAFAMFKQHQAHA